MLRWYNTVAGPCSNGKKILCVTRKFGKNRAQRCVTKPFLVIFEAKIVRNMNCPFTPVPPQRPQIYAIGKSFVKHGFFIYTTRNGTHFLSWTFKIRHSGAQHITGRGLVHTRIQSLWHCSQFRANQNPQRAWHFC